MKEYIIHGTLDKNLLHILQDGFIDNNPPFKNIAMLSDNHPAQIFTQLMYYDIPNQKNEIPHWMYCCIILDKQILKDYPFYATSIGKFSDTFKNGKDDPNTIISGDGNLTRMPTLTKLKNHINTFMNKNTKFLHRICFIHSHEILFNKKIYLDKYCVAIMLRFTKAQYTKASTEDKDIITKIINLSLQNNIPLKFRDYKCGARENTINNFIDSIITPPT